jgi:hypothetical protein
MGWSRRAHGVVCKVFEFTPMEFFLWGYVQDQVKVKTVPLHAMEALRGRGGIAPTHT